MKKIRKFYQIQLPVCKVELSSGIIVFKRMLEIVVKKVRIAGIVLKCLFSTKNTKLLKSQILHATVHTNIMLQKSKEFQSLQLIGKVLPYSISYIYHRPPPFTFFANPTPLV